MAVRSNKHCQEISLRLINLREYIYANANKENCFS